MRPCRQQLPSTLTPSPFWCPKASAVRIEGPLLGRREFTGRYLRCDHLPLVGGRFAFEKEGEPDKMLWYANNGFWHAGRSIDLGRMTGYLIVSDSSVIRSYTHTHYIYRYICIYMYMHMHICMYVCMYNRNRNKPAPKRWLAWPSQGILLLQIVRARSNHCTRPPPFRILLQYYCTHSGQYTTPLNLPCVCHAPYNIGGYTRFLT